MRDTAEHYPAAWEGPRETIAWTRGPVNDLGKEFRILRFELPSSWVRRLGGRRGSRLHAYATTGASLGVISSKECVEFLLLSTTQGMDVAELLVVTAHYHRTGKRLGRRHTVNWGRPWRPGSEASYAYLASADPLFTFGGHGNAELPCGVLWLIPITEAERQYKIDHGHEAFEELLLSRAPASLAAGRRPAVV